MGRDGVQVSHLQFVDDTICFIKDSKEQVIHLKYILKIYETISGLMVNFSKSNLAEIGVDEGVVCWYAQLLGCRVEHWPLNYLWMPLGGSQKSCAFWDLVVKMVNKLSGWNHFD